MLASFASRLIIWVDALPPNKKEIELIKIDFPAPLSPVSTLNPFSKVKSKFSINAMFFIERLSSISQAPTAILYKKNIAHSRSAIPAI